MLTQPQVQVGPGLITPVLLHAVQVTGGRIPTFVELDMRVPPAGGPLL